MLSTATRLNVPRTLGPRKAVTPVFGRYALVQRSTGPQTENVLEHLPEHRRPIVKAVRRSLTYTWPIRRQDNLQQGFL